MRIRGFKRALVVTALSAFSSWRRPIWSRISGDDTVAGNDCSGVFGQGFENCKIPANIDPNESPDHHQVQLHRAMCRASRDQFAVSVDRRHQVHFQLEHRRRQPGLGLTTGAGRSGDQFLCREGWTRRFNLFSNLGDPNSDGGLHRRIQAANRLHLSHVSFYDTGTPVQVPEPGSLALLGARAAGNRRPGASSQVRSLIVSS